MQTPDSSAAVNRPAWTNADITALVLAGGRGMRMGGVDKGLQSFNGQALVQHALQRLADQSGGPLHGVIVNANRNPEQYQALANAHFGAGFYATVVPDRNTDYAGPLAGFQAGLDACPSAMLLTVPCDSPLFPTDLADRLRHALLEADADIAVVHAPETGRDGTVALRSQPVFCLMRCAVSHSLHAFLASGGRKVDTWFVQLRSVPVPFNLPTDDPRAFTNANTLDELRQLENR
jgi:molybdopterin-guanine dinucleotide biosynthesis protein A